MEIAFSLLIGSFSVCVVLWLRARFASFHGQKPTDYDGLGPDFDLRKHLNGKIHCEGVIFGPTGRVSSRFVADMHGSWTGNTGVLSQSFRFDNGVTQERAWHLQLDENGHFDATADDIIGTGGGEQCGPTVQLRYRLRLPKDVGGHVLNTVDWMYIVPGGTIINRSQFRLFGIKVAELVATMRPRENT